MIDSDWPRRQTAPRVDKVGIRDQHHLASKANAFSATDDPNSTCSSQSRACVGSIHEVCIPKKRCFQTGLPPKSPHSKISSLLQKVNITPTPVLKAIWWLIQLILITSSVSGACNYHSSSPGHPPSFDVWLRFPFCNCYCGWFVASSAKSRLDS